MLALEHLERASMLGSLGPIPPVVWLTLNLITLGPLYHKLLPPRWILRFYHYRNLPLCIGRLGQPLYG